MIFRGNHFVLLTLSEAAQSQAVVPIASLESTGQFSNSPSIFSQGQPAVSSADRQVRRISPYPEESEFLENLLMPTAAGYDPSAADGLLHAVRSPSPQ